MADIAEGQEPEGRESAEPKSYDEAYVKELRGEAAKHRTEKNTLKKQVEDLDAKLRGLEDAGKSELEKVTGEKVRLERELADKEREVAEREVKAQVFAAAAKLNIVDPDMAYLALDLASLDPDDPKAVQRALIALAKEKPYLVKESTPPTPGVGGPPVQGKKSVDDMMLDLLHHGGNRQA